MDTETLRDALDKPGVVDQEAVREPTPRSSTKSPDALDQLLERVTEDNIHPEQDTGPAVGREILEDFALAEAIREGLETGSVSRDEVFRVLQDQP